MKDAKQLIGNWNRHQSLMLFLCFFFLFMSAGVSEPVHATVTETNQQTQIKGVVKDANGDPVVGATVMLKGTTVGTVTDIDGNYNISVPGSKSVLTFSFVGYTTKEVTVGNQRTINVILSEDSKLIDEVVVVGYGTQKKVNLTGSVASVGADRFENRPVANVGQALAGVVPNLNINIETGSPSATPTFNIRGGTSMKMNTDKKVYEISNGEPLIMIDGVESTGALLNQLNPNDIASMSVIKDASAGAIYGTKAAFGVILITTKSGAFGQKTRINYNFDMSWDTPSALPDVMSSYMIQKASMEKAEWIGAGVSSGAQRILDAMANYEKNPTPENAYFVDGGNRIWVATMNPFKEAVRNWTPTQKHNISISGGSEKVSYYLSLSYMNQEGMYNINSDTYDRYNGMLSLNAQVTDRLKVNARMQYNQTIYKAPYVPAEKTGGADNNKYLWSYMKGDHVSRNINLPIMTGPNDPIFPNGYTDNILSWVLYGASYSDKNTSTMMTIAPEFTIIPKTLNLKADYTYYPQSNHYKRYAPMHEFMDPTGSIVTQYSQSNKGNIKKKNTDSYTFNIYADFTKTFFKKHTLSAVGGFYQRRVSYDALEVDMQYLLDPNILNPENSSDSKLQTPKTEGWNVAERAAFGRINYNYADKYLLEVNGRYDGSSRFTQKDRFLFFPSFSAGWRISEEAFMAGTKSVLDNLKLRGSYGTLGNQPSEQYPYQAILKPEVGNYIINGQVIQKVGAPTLVSPMLTWEKATTIDFGFDATLLKNRLDVSFDWYKRTTKDVLTDGGVAYPAVLGATAPTTNSGKLRAAGWELSLKWSDKLKNGEVRYDVSLTVSDARTKVLRYAANPERFFKNGSNDILYDGMYIGDIWGYETGGILQESDGQWYMDGTTKKWKPNPEYLLFNGSETLYPGYLWRKDINGDGKLNDGSASANDPGDKKLLGNSTPRYRFGITTNWYYKGFDFNLFLQGVAKRDVWLTSSTYWGYGAGSEWMYNHSWRPDRTNAEYPMYSFAGTTPPIHSRYMKNGAYLRCKQLALGYTLPKLLTQKAHIEKVRVFASAYNLFEITAIPSTFDPDQLTDAYPNKRTIAIGLQVGF